MTINYDKFISRDPTGMTIHRPSADEILEEYLRKYPDETTALNPLRQQLAEEPDTILLRWNMRGHITTSMFVLNHERTHALLIHHKHHGIWLQPGGHYESETLTDSLASSALREVEEETGVTAKLLTGCPLDVDTHSISARPEKNEGAHFHHDFVFLGIAPIDASLVHQEEEVHGVRWVPFEELMEFDGRRMKRMTAKAIAIISG